MKPDLAAIRNDREPTRRALAMARAIRQHLQDLHEDDPGDTSNVAIENALGRATVLVRNLASLTRRNR